MLIALCSAKGSPGVTTVALALAAQWPDISRTRRLVAECDPSGGDLAVRFGRPASPGMVSFAAAARHDNARPDIWAHTQPLPGGVQVLAAPPGAVHARAAIRTLELAPGRAVLDETACEAGTVTLADCGRMDPGSPAEWIARRADALVLVAGSHADELAHVSGRLQELAKWTPRPGLVLTGRGHSTEDIERELGIPTLARIPHDPGAAAALAGRRSSSRRHGGLMRSAAALAHALATPVPAQTVTASPIPLASLEGSAAHDRA